MILRHILKDQPNAGKYIQWIIASGQLSFVAGILLSRWVETPVTALLSGIFLGLSIVLNLTWLYLWRGGQRGGNS